MPVQYSIRENGRFLHIKTTGRLKSEEINDFMKTLTKDNMLRNEHVTLVDTTGAEGESLTDTEFTEVLKMLSEFPEKLIAKKLAILIKDKRFTKHAVKYQGLSSGFGIPTKVFNTLFEATTWLMSNKD